MAGRRKPPAPSITDAVLTSARRRCCICFGLHRDTSLKQGQIAHLDGDRNNNSLENLAFLCLNHHDQYDGRTSQSKGLTKGEVKTYRAELHDALRQALVEKPVSFANTMGFLVVDYSGQYIRQGMNDSADITIRRLANDSYHVDGLALWGTNREHGPNTGELDFIATLTNNQLSFSAPLGDKMHKVLITIEDDKLEVVEENWLGAYGMNVCFEGVYAKAT